MEETSLANTSKKWLDTLGNSTLFLINYTIIFIPFFLFIKLSDGKDIVTALPFVLFYCLRLTGISLLLSIKNTVNSLHLLFLSLALAFIGSVLAAFGPYFFPLYFFSSIFLGLGASWVMPAEISVNYYEAQKGWRTKTNYPMVLVILAVFFAVFHFFYNSTLIMLFYSLFFVFSFLAVRHFPAYDLTAPVEDREVSKQEFISFILFFILLFFLRTGRLVGNRSFFDYATIAASILFLVITLFGNQITKSIPRRAPSHLRLLTYLDGFISNYVFLFGSIYITGIYGEQDLVKKLFLPFFLGMTLAMYLNPKMKKLWGEHLKTYSLLAVLAGLFLILTNTWITFSIFLISFFRTLFNSWITSSFYQMDSIPQDKRVLTKFTIQNRGSMLHQFILMGIIILLSKFDRTSIMMFLTFEIDKQSSLSVKELVHQANYIASTLIILLILANFFYEGFLAKKMKHK